MQSKDEYTVNLKRIADGLVKKWWIIALSAGIGGAAAFMGSNFLLTPKYTAEALMYVNNSAISVGSIKATISAQDLTAAQGLVDTYTVILNSRNTLEDVIAADELPYSYKELKQMIKAQPVNNTEVFSIDVTSSSPTEAEEVANTIAKILPDKISDIVEGSSAKIVDYAVIPPEKSSPNVARWTVLTAIASGLIAAAVIALRETANDQIKDPKDLMDRYPKTPVLANIPNLSARAKTGYGYGEYRKHTGSDAKGSEQNEADQTSHSSASQSGRQASHQAGSHAKANSHDGMDTETIAFADPADTKNTDSERTILSRAERYGKGNQG